MQFSIVLVCLLKLFVVHSNMFPSNMFKSSFPFNKLGGYDRPGYDYGSSSYDNYDYNSYDYDNYDENSYDEQRAPSYGRAEVGRWFSYPRDYTPEECDVESGRTVPGHCCSNATPANPITLGCKPDPIPLLPNSNRYTTCSTTYGTTECHMFDDCDSTCNTNTCSFYFFFVAGQCVYTLPDSENKWFARID